jgi:hypothetical protein
MRIVRHFLGQLVIDGVGAGDDGNDYDTSNRQMQRAAKCGH